MDHFSADVPLPDAVVRNDFARADLAFYGVDHGGLSYTARVFVDEGSGEPDLSPEREDGYAGMFAIFGHGGCFGDDDHCEVPRERDPFDTRPPKGLAPQTVVVTVTDALKQVEGDRVRVTVIPFVPSEDGPQREDVLKFTDLRLLTYR